MPRSILTISHSYVVGQNRRLADELQRAGGGEWNVVAAAPCAFRGDLRPITLERRSDELARVVGVPAYGTGRVHTFVYGRALRHLMQGPWDIVHAWEEPFIASGAQIAAWLPPSAKLVYATFQNYEKRYPVPFRQMQAYAMKKASGWIAWGRSVEEALAHQAPYQGKPRVVIPPGVDIGVFKPNPAARCELREALGWSPDGAPVVGYLGRFIEAKGLRLLMQALDAQAEGSWRSLFVGGGPMQSELEAWAKRHGDRAKIVTGVVHDKVPEVLAAMDILAAPSETTPEWREQFGRMLVEGFACGLCVLGSDSGEIPHTVGDGGLVLPEKDGRAWTERLRALLADAGEIAAWGARGRERAERVFAWPVVAERTLRFFEELSER